VIACWTGTLAAQPRRLQVPPITAQRAPVPAAAIAAFERGLAAYNADDLEGAMDAFEEAVRLAPHHREAHINLGIVYLRLQRPSDALRELAQATLDSQPPKRVRRNRCSD
jgi:Flp pilus assembly protein TadD